jgi:hypothetical protein
VTPTTEQLWEKQDQHTGDRHRLFTAIEEAFEVETVLYPGSYVDVAPSFVFGDVTYLDTDRRAAKFFGDQAGVKAVIARHRKDDSDPEWRFVHTDYTSGLDLKTDHYDLLVSLYAGFVSEHCTKYLRPGGFLLVNPSHGDAAMASINPKHRLAAVVKSRSGKYAVSRDDLDAYLQPKRPTAITADYLHVIGRGVAYTKPVFAYVFQLSDPTAP